MAFKSKYKGFEIESLLDKIASSNDDDGSQEIPEDLLEVINSLYTSNFNEDFNKDFKI
jgi:hypothetical protein